MSFLDRIVAMPAIVDLAPSLPGAVHSRRSGATRELSRRGDGAGWHDERALTVPDNLTLVPLPAYSPELNPVERVWLYLRERFLSLRFLPDTAAIIEACLPRLERPHRRAGPYPIPVRLSLDYEARFIDSLVLFLKCGGSV